MPLTMAFAPLSRTFFVSVGSQPPVALRPSLDGPDRLTAAVEKEFSSSPHAGMGRWSTLIAEASERFGIPRTWIRAVLNRESGGRTTVAGVPITSRSGAMGLMQLMPKTYAGLRRQYALGRNPYDPHDNIIAATAYLKMLRARYGYPGMFAAYNIGPGNFERYRQSGTALPRTTRNYVAAIVASAGHPRSPKREEVAPAVIEVHAPVIQIATDSAVAGL
jgi:soluble lytic murein transglycosylase-like protein